MTLELIEEAVSAGARQGEAAKLLGLDPRTVQRWRTRRGGEDGRCGPKRPPANRLSDAERTRILQAANSPEFRDLSPRQIVPVLAERGIYVGSESTFYRVLAQEQLSSHRERSRPPTRRHKPDELVATGPDQVWSRDITCVPSPVRGAFHFLYMVVDVSSRKVVAAAVHAQESSQHAAGLLRVACEREGVVAGSLVVHMAGGGPMKGATLRATLERLGVTSSYSRPSVSNDNPYSESLFRTLKYRPEYPSDPFASIEDAERWVADFVSWYNTRHRHSAIRFVTPEQRHSGRDLEILARRRETCRNARARHPERWTGALRNWTPVEEVMLNPDTAA